MSKEQVTVVEMKIYKGTFKGDDNQDVDYIICEADFFGEKIKFFPRTEDKKLFNYLVNQLVR